jgi:hypothetical protein
MEARIENWPLFFKEFFIRELREISEFRGRSITVHVVTCIGGQNVSSGAQIERFSKIFFIHTDQKTAGTRGPNFRDRRPDWLDTNFTNFHESGADLPADRRLVPFRCVCGGLFQNA